MQAYNNKLERATEIALTESEKKAEGLLIDHFKRWHSDKYSENHIFSKLELRYIAKREISNYENTLRHLISAVAKLELVEEAELARLTMLEEECVIFNKIEEQ